MSVALASITEFAQENWIVQARIKNIFPILFEYLDSIFIFLINPFSTVTLLPSITRDERLS